MAPIQLVFFAFILTATAQYNLVDNYTPTTFAGKFDFFTDDDPTNGYVNYVSYDTALSTGLYNASSTQVRIGVDDTNVATGRGRNSVRIASKTTYDHSLVVLDLSHMPGSVCGTWPAFWLLGANWPNGGEIDIIEGVNSQNYNTMAAHTNAGCSISNTGGMSGTLVTSDCDVNDPNQGTNQGCSIKTGNTDSYGDGFNSQQGGVYATEWTSTAISIWYFPRSAIPADLTTGNPDPSAWGLPLANFAGACDWDQKLAPQQILFDVTFCGDWAGNAFSSDPVCGSKASTCQAFVQNNPSAFSETYWAINSLKVYQTGASGLPSTTSSISSTTSTSFVSTSLSMLTTFTTLTQVTTTLPSTTTTSSSSPTSSTFATTTSAIATTTTAFTSSASVGSSTFGTTTTIIQTTTTQLITSTTTTAQTTEVTTSTLITPSTSSISASTTSSTISTTPTYTTPLTSSWPRSSYTPSWTTAVVASSSWNSWPDANSAPAQNPWNGADQTAWPGSGPGQGHWGPP